MTRTLLIASLFVLPLSGCGGGAADTSSESPVAESPTAEAAPEAASGETAPEGSAGAYTLRFAESDDEGAPATEVSGFLPAPVPRDAVALTALEGVPSYHIGVDKGTIPDGYELNGTYFVFVQAGEDGRNKVSLLRGHVGLSNNFQNPYQGSIAAFTFPPMWDATASDVTLSLDRMGDEKGQVATTPLTVMSERPVWARPVALPAVTTDADPKVTAEVDLTDEDAMIYLLYRDDNGWALEDFRPDRSETRRREREDDTRTTTPYLVYPEDINADSPEAYLLVFRL